MSAAPQLPPDGGEELSKMSFGDHLDELRRRLFYSLIAVAVCVLGLLPFKDSVTDLYVRPYRAMWFEGFEDHIERVTAKVAAAGGVEALAQQEFGALLLDQHQWLQRYGAAIRDRSYPFTDHAEAIKNRGGYGVSYYLVATRPIEDFWTFMAASFLFSMMIAGPFVLYQAWAFVAAGLYQRERRAALRYLPGSTVLLIAGVLFGYFVVVPYALYFLVRLMNFGQVQPLLSVSQYFSLLFMLTAALGLVFQLPLVMLLLNRVGVVSHAAFVKNWRYVVLGLFVAAALFTPPDPFTMVMMGLPMVVLFGLGLLLTARAERRSAAAADAPASEGSG